VRTLSEPLPENTEIRRLLKNSGEWLLFSKSDPGRLRGYMIIGVARTQELEPYEVAGPFNIMKDAKGRITKVTDGKGQTYSVDRVLDQSRGRLTILASAWAPVAVPLAEVRQIEAKKASALKGMVFFSAAIVAITIVPLIWGRVF
jgi:hypothetical protein